jgi:hypothetical protein
MNEEVEVKISAYRGNLVFDLSWLLSNREIDAYLQGIKDSLKKQGLSFTEELVSKHKVFVISNIHYSLDR